jgi:hypothetical protein
MKKNSLNITTFDTVERRICTDAARFSNACIVFDANHKQHARIGLCCRPKNRIRWCLDFPKLSLMHLQPSNGSLYLRYLPRCHKTPIHSNGNIYYRNFCILLSFVLQKNLLCIFSFNTTLIQHNYP